jgi:ATP-dependent RNA helicase SUPV3L1/SUV3
MLDADDKGNERAAKIVIPEKYSDPKKVYLMLEEAKPGTFTSAEKARLSWIFHRFAESGWVSDQALALYINSKFFPTSVSRFRKFFQSRATPELRGLLIQMGPTRPALQFLFPIFAEFCNSEFSAEIDRYRELVSTADLTKPDAWYPFARAMKRKVIYHQGPTNSGKTYMALKRFMEAANGIYCSPLRLLAMEVFDKVNGEGIYCNLHTGQEKKDLPFANHLACTVEMAYLSKQWEVAVIDEVQMMSDEYRGWAWTRAFLGLQADEIHVCGDPSAVPLLRSICAQTGDELIENEYERFKPLKLDQTSLNGDFSNVQAGDCIVAFSRKDIFDVKREVELATNHKCCVVYGALPPETRTQQAKLFNDPNSGYDVLVASDAVGMGLNLNIRRVVFYSLDKFDGDAKRPIPAPQVKQIAGRAGRRGSIFPDGITTAFYSQDIPYLEQSLQQDFEPATAAGLFPVYEQVELFASQLPETSFAQLLERFAQTCRLDGAYFLCRYDNLKRVAGVLDKVKGLSLEDRFNFCFTPVNVRDAQSLGALYRYALAFSQKIPVYVRMGAPLNSARDEFELMDLETRHQVLSMYLWLSHHFPEELFVQKERAAAMATHIATLLGQSLTQSAGHWHRRGRIPGLKKVNGRVVAARPGLRPKVLRPSSRTQESTVVDREPITVPAVC